jgi:hypothetical protein
MESDDLRLLTSDAASTVAGRMSQDRDWCARAGAPRDQAGPGVTDEHRRSTKRPTGTETDRRLTRISAGQTPYDLARPKGFEPLTF